jgi:hypothetical protein
MSNDHEVAVSERASNLVGGICGLAAVALLIGGLPFTGATPEPGASADDVAEYLSRSSAQTWTGIYLELFGLALFIIFIGRLWALLREAEGVGGWIATTALGAALAALTVLVMGDATMMGAAFSAGRHGLDPAVVGGMYTVQWYADLAFGAVNAVFFAAASARPAARGSPEMVGLARTRGRHRSRCHRAVWTWDNHGAAAPTRIPVDRVGQRGDDRAEGCAAGS